MTDEHGPARGPVAARSMRKYVVVVGETAEVGGLTGKPVFVTALTDRAVAFYAEQHPHPGVFRRFRVFPTGESLPEGAEYRGSCVGIAQGLLDAAQVLHLYDTTGVL